MLETKRSRECELCFRACIDVLLMINKLINEYRLFVRFNSTGRRVLSREERRAREREELEREEEESRRQDLGRARRNFLTDAEVDELERNRPTRGFTNTPEKAFKSPEFRGILNQTEQAFTSPTPRPATITSPPPYVGARPRLPSQAERLMDQLEDVR